MPDPAGGVVLIVVVSWLVHLAPTLIALVRRPPGVAAVVLVNLLLGWTIVGWAVALVLSLRTREDRTLRPAAVASA